MDRKEAERRFAKADKLFTYGRFDDVLVELDYLEAHFPDNHRILNAKARTLERLDRHDEALAICDRLLDEFGYEKIRTFRDNLAHTIATQDSAPQQAFWGIEPGGGTEDDPSDGRSSAEVDSRESVASRFRVKPVRLLLLIALVALMAFGLLPYWLGVLLLLGYFAVKFALGRFFLRLFSAPFKMKGKALAGATCELHGVEWTDAPADVADQGGEAASESARRYAWIDVTITPRDQTDGFTHWEPGELMLAPCGKAIKRLDDLEDCFGIHDYKLPGNDKDASDAGGGKYEGPLRLRLLAEVPAEGGAFQFVYYFESFGEFTLRP